MQHITHWYTPHGDEHRDNLVALFSLCTSAEYYKYSVSSCVQSRCYQDLHSFPLRPRQTACFPGGNGQEAVFDALRGERDILACRVAGAVIARFHEVDALRGVISLIDRHIVEEVDTLIAANRHCHMSTQEGEAAARTGIGRPAHTNRRQGPGLPAIVGDRGVHFLGRIVGDSDCRASHGQLILVGRPLQVVDNRRPQPGLAEIGGLHDGDRGFAVLQERCPDGLAIDGINEDL